ncbi:MAG: tRNA (adenosine(37)-N6)-threonylcarbamoyltransferase complex ATPase subunit type 1 TsaE [bacterium]|nr:tRNA (adenosine(37)-N6)-threonylcarbamoyltransferase complex ATPase subunit type 1 TsaE [bacterium]
MIYETVSTNSEDTQRLGQLLGRLLKSPEVVELRSDLGGGKTTFVRGLARGLGSKDSVASPTFTLNKIYKGKDSQIHHYDFYRLYEAGIMSDELAESLQNPKVITVIEWSDVVQNVLPKERLSIEFKPTANDSEEREIAITYPETKAKLIRKLETAWQEQRP